MHRAVAIVLLLLAAALPAEGRQLVLQTPRLDEPALVPLQQTTVLHLPYSISCQSVAQHFQGAVLTFEFTAPDGVILAGSNTVPVAEQNCALEPTREGEATFTVAVTDEVPGEVLLPVTVRASLSPDPVLQSALDPSRDAEVPLTVVARFHGTMAATVADSHKTGASSTFRVDLQNHANARMQVEVEVVDKPSGVRVVVPDPVLVPDAGETGDPLLVKVHSDLGSSGDVVLRLIPRSTRDETQFGQPVEVTLHVGNELVGKDAPVPAVVPLAALLVAILGARRRAA